MSFSKCEPFTEVDGYSVALYHSRRWEALVRTNLEGLSVDLHVRALEGLQRIPTRRLRFRRIVVAEKETPNMLADLI